MLLTIAVSILWTLCVSLPMAVSAEFHLMGQYKPRKSFEQKGRALATQRHEVLISIKKKNMDEFQQMVLERATPGSASYQQWFSYDEVTTIVENPEAFERVQAWLGEHDVRVNWVSPRRDYISAETTVQQWEELLDAEFFEFHDHSYRLESGQPQLEPTSFVRSLSYSIPKELQGDIDAIFGTVQAPIAYHKSFQLRERDTHGFPAKTTLRISPKANKNNVDLTAASAVTVSYLNSYYEIGNNLASATLNQSVFMTSNEYFSQGDLQQFQEMFGLTVQPAISIGGHSTPSCPTTSGSSISCSEGNLDIQYIMGVAQVSGSIFWYVPNESGVDSFTTWLTEMVNDPNPPQSNSMSWGSVEQQVDVATLRTFDNEASILAGMGVTIMVASGDNGVSNFYCSCTLPSGSNSPGTDWPYSSSWSGQGYFPSFPASSPWVTAVGATMGYPNPVPSVGSPEIACQSQLGGVITTGGGFSTFYKMPSWQSEAVSLYFERLGSNQPPPGFNPQGRALPDISYIGVYYQVLIGGKMFSIFGTSASSPMFAAMVTLVNSLRQAEGKPMVGFINPTLYAVGLNNTLGLSNIFDNATFNDVTSGDNRCCVASNSFTEPTCCVSGFDSAPGWDPVTGWGSMNMPDFAKIFGVSAPYVPSTSSSSEEISSTALIIGIVIVVLAVIVAALAIYFCCCLPRNPMSQQESSSARIHQPLAPTSVQMAPVQATPVQIASTPNPAYRQR